MLANSKNVLFDDNFKLKLENPQMPVESWMSHIDERKCSFRVEKIVVAKKMTGTRYGYKVSTRDPLWPDCQAAVRHASDFHLLYSQLEKRFPNAVVPKVSKREVDNLHLMELYLTEISMNPFFRMDVAFSDFLNGKMKDYKQTKKNDRKHSQGTLRWLQQNTEYKEFTIADNFIKSIKGDFDQLERAQKSIIHALAIEIKALNEFQLATQEFTKGLGDYLAMEQVSATKHAGSIAGLPPNRLAERLSQLMTLNQDHLRGLQQAYDPGSLERLTVHPILIEMKMLSALKKVLDVMAKAKSDYEKSKAHFDGIPNEDPNKQKAMNGLGIKEIYYFKQRRAFGFELERFRTYRTVKFQTFMNQVIKFNLRGAKRIGEEWAKSGISLDPREEQEFFTMDKIYNQMSQNPVGRNRALSINQSTKKQNKKFMITASEYKSLKVVNAVSGGMGSKYIKLKKDEVVVGYQTAGGDWIVKRGDGKEGLAKNTTVVLYNPANAPADPYSGMGLSQTIKPPMQRPQAPVMGGGSSPIPAQYMDDDGWSTDDENEPSPSMQPPNMPVGIPVGMSAKTMGPPMGMAQAKGAPMPPPSAPKPPMNTAPVPPMNPFASQKPAGFNPMAPKPPSAPQNNGFSGGAQPAAPFGAPAPKPPSNGFGAPQAPTGGFGAPGPQPTGPSFGAPGPRPTGPSFGGPAPPSQPMAPKAAPKPVSKPAKTKPPKKKKGGPAGRPPNPFGGGGASFLADIKKGNNMKKLNKVPEAEKSKEIGGQKGTSAAEKGAGKKAAGGGGGGGGGLFGELNAAMMKRR